MAIQLSCHSHGRHANASLKIAYLVCAVVVRKLVRERKYVITLENSRIASKTLRGRVSIVASHMGFLAPARRRVGTRCTYHAPAVCT